MQHRLRPRVGVSGRLLQLKNQPIRPWPKRCGAIEVATSIENDASGRVGTVLSIEEIDCFLRPCATFVDRWREFEYYAAPRASDTALARSFLVVAAEVCRAVNRAYAIEHECPVGVCAIANLLTGLDALTPVEHLLRPLASLCLRRAQFVDRPAVLVVGFVARSIAATVSSRAVNVALGIECEALSGKLPVFVTLEAVQHRLGPSFALFRWWRQLIHCAAADHPAEDLAPSGAAVARRTIEVAGAVDQQCPGWRGAIAVELTLEDV